MGGRALTCDKGAEQHTRWQSYLYSFSRVCPLLHLFIVQVGGIFCVHRVPAALDSELGKCLSDSSGILRGVLDFPYTHIPRGSTRILESGKPEHKYSERKDLECAVSLLNHVFLGLILDDASSSRAPWAESCCLPMLCLAAWAKDHTYDTNKGSCHSSGHAL